jgi:Yersinia/Haemophilus virulence surface antigen
MSYQEILKQIDGKGAQDYNQSNEAIRTHIDIKNGVCRGLVTTWLIAKKKDESFWKDRGTIKEPLLAASKVLAKAVNQQGEYEKSATESGSYDVDEATENALSSAGIAFAQQDVIASGQEGITGTAYGDQSAKIAQQVLGAKSRLFILSIGGNSGRHSIGIFRPYAYIGKSNRAYLFDPNFGEFEVESVKNLGKLLKSLATAGYAPLEIGLFHNYILWSFVA